MKPDLLPLLACPRCEAELRADAPIEEELQSGELRCGACDSRFDIVRGVPCLLPHATSATSDLYSDIWQAYDTDSKRPSGREADYRAPAVSHLDLLRMASGSELIQGRVGIDAGCGSGSSTLQMAERHPEIQFVGIDLSEGPVLAAGKAAALGNAHMVRGDLMHPPLARESFDFAYSFGVLHHTPEPERAFGLLLERLRPGARITLFLYKDFSDIPLKRLALRTVNSLRRITTRLRPATLRRLSRLLAPLVFACTTLPARLLQRLGAERLGRHIPYATFPDAHSVAASLEDRFGAPYEFRFSSSELEGWAERAGLAEARVVDCLPYGFSGLVLTGLKGGVKSESATH